MNPATYFYLHGFASGPGSSKGVYLRDCFQSQGLELQIPDLNQGDFLNLTLTRQIHQVQALFPPPPEPVILIGSSLGGLSAAWVAEKSPQVQQLILLAPAFEFLPRWLEELGDEQVQAWQRQGSREFFHYGEQRQLPLGYEFVQDTAQYQDDQLLRSPQGDAQASLPTLILHGVEDEVVPIQASQRFAAKRPWVNLVELNSDHSLGNVKAEIWEAIQAFCSLA